VCRNQRQDGDGGRPQDHVCSRTADHGARRTRLSTRSVTAGLRSRRQTSASGLAQPWALRPGPWALRIRSLFRVDPAACPGIRG
jgi:hypothetical protein